MPRVTLDISDAQLARLQAQVRDVLGLKDELQEIVNAINDVGKIQEPPQFETHEIVFQEVNRAGEPCIYIAGNQQAKFGPVAMRAGGEWTVCVAAEYQPRNDRTRIILGLHQRHLIDVRFTTLDVEIIDPAREAAMREHKRRETQAILDNLARLEAEPAGVEGRVR